MAIFCFLQVTSFVIHDIRRTMRTGLSTLPVPDLIRELVIAHTKPGLHKVYDQHAYLDEKRHALDLWAKRLRDVVTPPPANVVELAGARAMREIPREELESRRLRRAFRRGEKVALLVMLGMCAYFSWKIPEWVTEALLDAWRRASRGELKSWDDVFGKLYGGRQRRRVQTLSHTWDVWFRVTELRDAGGAPQRRLI